MRGNEDDLDRLGKNLLFTDSERTTQECTAIQNKNKNEYKTNKSWDTGKSDF